MIRTNVCMRMYSSTPPLFGDGPRRPTALCLLRLVSSEKRLKLCLRPEESLRAQRRRRQARAREHAIVVCDQELCVTAHSVFLSGRGEEGSHCCHPVDAWLSGPMHGDVLFLRTVDGVFVSFLGHGNVDVTFLIFCFPRCLHSPFFCLRPSEPSDGTETCTIRSVATCCTGCTEFRPNPGAGNQFCAMFVFTCFWAAFTSRGVQVFFNGFTGGFQRPHF